MTSNKTKLPVSKSDVKAEEAFKALITKGIPLYFTYGLTQEHLDVLFETAYNLYYEKKYKEALSVFARITILNHFDKRGWIGSGVCWQILHRYNDAIDCYSRASLIDIKDPLPIFHAIECYIALKMNSDANSALEVIKPLIKDNPKFVRFKNASAKIEQVLQKNK
jgi:type III secretion system low calcium response chaperone LcrH/SycD